MTPPPGYRMLVQLVDATSEADARQTIWDMYGAACVAKAVFVAGTCKLVDGGHSGGKHFDGVRIRWVPQKSGWTVYVPQGFVLG